jgi:chromosome segregation ATPase
MNELLQSAWPSLLALLGGGAIGVVLRSLFANSSRRRLIEGHDEQVQRLQQQVSDRSARVTEVEVRSAELQRERDELKRALERLQADGSALQRQLAALEPLTTQLHERDQRLSAMDARAAEQRQALEQELLVARQQIGDAQRSRDAELKELRQQLQQAHTRAQTLAAQQQQDRSQALAEQPRERDVELGRLRSKVAEMEPLARAALDWQARHDIAVSKLGEAEQDRDFLRRRARELETRVAKLDDAASHRDAQLTAREVRVRELEFDLSRLRQRVLELEHLRGELQEHERRIAELLARPPERSYDAPQ